MSASGPNTTPITPEKQLTSRIKASMDSPEFDRIDCTPDTKGKLLSLKRKASNLYQSASPKETQTFLKWRLAIVASEIELRETQKKALQEADVFFGEVGSSKAEFEALVREKERSLSQEKIFLMSNSKILEEDLSEIINSRDRLQEAYINELRVALETASQSKDRYPGVQSPRLSRNEFSNVVHDYLRTKRGDKKYGDDENFCNVMGVWVASGQAKLAHIVPYSWSCRELGHMFGSDQNPLKNPRNGLSMHKNIEEAFDNCWVVVVPLGSLKPVPTRWKLVLLNSAVKDLLFFRDRTEKKEWYWRDIDGRELKFNNDNRPASRFLYLRYTLAILHAQDKGWSSLQTKCPPGQVWAKPDKPTGYLRKSILVELGKRVGDKIPRSLMDAGVFEDPETSSKILDEVAATRVIELVKDHLVGQRDREESEDKSGESDQSEDDA